MASESFGRTASPPAAGVSVQPVAANTTTPKGELVRENRNDISRVMGDSPTDRRGLGIFRGNRNGVAHDVAPTRTNKRSSTGDLLLMPGG